MWQEEHDQCIEALARIEALERALWFEHYKDVYPNAAVNHGDCEACRLLATLRSVGG
jgi:hypothetical protein